MPFTTDMAQSILEDKFAADNYIGLSTTIPNEDGSNFSEPSTSTVGYARSKIGELDKKIKKQIANKDYIFMFECQLDRESSIHFTHFGVFTDKNPGKGSPIFYGEIKSEDGTVGLDVYGGYVPMIRPHELIVGMDVVELITDYS